MMRRSTAAIGAALIAVAIILLGVAWAGSNPPGASPDEDAHVVKAYATADGQFDGEDYTGETSTMAPLSAAWFEDVGRSYLLPRAIVPPATVRCFAFDRNLTADCQVFPDSTSDRTPTLTPTHFGTYSPVLYLPLGAAMLDASDYRSAEWRGRLVAVAISGLFIAWAALLLSSRGSGWFPLAGLVAATTPAVIFLAASVTTSGIEIAAAICFWAAALRLARAPAVGAGAPWAAAAISGGVLALSRPLDAVLIVVAIITLIVLSGASELRRLVSANRLKSAVTGGVVAVCVAISALWSLLVTPHPTIDGGLALRSIDDALRDAPNQLRQVIGVFGWNDTPMPQGFYVLGIALLVVVIGASLVVGTRRERLALAALTVSIVAIHLGLAVLVEAQIGFGMQARYVMPLVVGLILLAADTLEQNRQRLPAAVTRFGPAATIATLAIIQAAALITNAHRYAVGANGAWGVPWDSVWTPDGGFAVWLGIAGVGIVCLAAAAVLAATARTDSA
jgi:hypothetical protein